MKGLFINNQKAQDSIYESGLMVFNALKLSHKYQLNYIEISAEKNEIPTGYQFYFFNYHPSTMQWLDTRCIKQLNGLKVTMVLEILPNDPFVLCPDNHFDAYVVLDPTIKHKNKKVFAFPRPLEKINFVPQHQTNEIPVIGTFGFATKGKGFQHVVEAVNKEFERAIIKLNIPFGNYVPDSENYAHFLGKLCIDKAKSGIEVIVTHDYMDKDELIKWCASNTLNCFLYDRNMPGLAATTDQAIIANRPLSISNNDTFRHVIKYLTPYPTWSLKKSIDTSLKKVQQMAKDWTSENFALQFENLLAIYPLKLLETNKEGKFTLVHKTNSVGQFIAHRYRKYKRLLSIQKIKDLLTA
ncbi:MAG: class I SAM-dependent methyltransferase, partial [Deinococcales bacterium]|nr:class I SAM-dependent methyltransferase [Chitinophagaceae bacterium]